eukprot:Rhum_TRINITY_DN15307_c4_g2::Rhum_TRINITY_DN15307_c4_g2_i1::g.151893::m.151893
MSTAGLRRGLSPPLKHGRSMSSDEVLRFLPVQSGLADPVVAAAAAGRTPQWVFPDASPSHTADYPAAAPSPRVDPAVHVQRLIEALTRDKNALEQLHLEGQLENAQLRSQVQEIADAFKEALADNAPQECERCGHLWREIEAGRKEAARLRAELLDAATEAEAHKLRYDIFVRDAAAASDLALQLLLQGGDAAVQAVRRLPVVCVEDALPHPGLVTLSVFLMLAAARGYSPTLPVACTVAARVAEAAAVRRRFAPAAFADRFPAYRRAEAVLRAAGGGGGGSAAGAAPPTVFGFCLRVRRAFGGMPHDMRMLDAVLTFVERDALYGGGGGAAAAAA